MQTIITYLALLLTGLFVQAQNTIVVNVDGFSNNDGTAMVAVYDSEENFLEKRYKGDLSRINDQKVSFRFENIPDGTYAISVVHDEDSNGKLNMVMGFYPSEDTGASNNAPARFGPPKWRDAKFALKNGSVITQNINL